MISWLEGYYPVSIYKDTTNQFSDEECDQCNVVEIPVPKDLLFEWFMEDPERRDFVAQFDAQNYILMWVFEESTCDDTVNLYGWLMEHGYFWRRLD